MDKKEKALLRQLFDACNTVVNVMSQDNADAISALVRKLDEGLKGLTDTSAPQRSDFWKVFAKMSDDEIIAEFSNEGKYPTIGSIKDVMRGILDTSKVSKIKTREGLIKHIIAVKHKDDYIRDIFKEK